MKKLIKLTESDLHRIIKQSVNTIISETNKQHPMTQWFRNIDEAYKPLGVKYSGEHINNVTNDFKRQVGNLLKFMNAYSDSILSNNIVDENSYNKLNKLLTEIDFNLCDYSI